MKVGIVGHGEDKFTAKGRDRAEKFIESILTGAEAVVSGHSPVGGIDIWAEDIGRQMGLKLMIYEPRQHRWDAEYGYKKRNLDIASNSDIVFVILVDRYPPDYKGMVFNGCYHCGKTDHVKSGGCWTGLQAKKMGKPVKWVIIENE